MTSSLTSREVHCTASLLLMPASEWGLHATPASASSLYPAVYAASMRSLNSS